MSKMATDDARARELAGNIQRGASNRLREIWWAILLRGILALVLAAGALFWPERTMSILVKLLGIYFLIDGLWGAFTAWRSGDGTATPFQAVVSLILGLTLLFWTGISTRVFLVIAGIWALLQGAGVVVSSRKLEANSGDRMFMAVVGVVIALVGVAFILWPETGVVTVSWLIGVGAGVVGLLLVYLATRLKRVRKRLDSIGK
jgi:uncharacterized membrane protein HdeD (DUF308 family)